MITIGTPVELITIRVGDPVNFIGVPGAGGLTGHIHTQTLAATVWTVNHNLGRYPAAVSLFSADFSVQWAEFAVQHVNTNTLNITADVAISGKAFIE